MDTIANIIITALVAVVPVNTINDLGEINIQDSEQITQKQEELSVEQKAKNLARDKILARWEKKQLDKWNNLPKNKFTINTSAYTAAADECGKSDGITASGLKVEQKRTLACPPEYPFGAKIAIDGMGIYTCEDRGGAIKGNKFDIYVKTKSEAFAFGRQNRTASVVF